MIPQNEAPLEGQNHLRWCTFGFTSEGRTAWVLTNPSMRGNELSCVKVHCQIHMLRIIPLSIFLRKCSVAIIESASLLVKERFLHGTSRTPQNIFCAPKAKQNQGCVLLSWHSLAWTQPVTLPSRFSWNMTWLDYQQKLVNESCKVTFHQFGDSGYIWLQICCFYAVLLLTSEFPYSLDKQLRPTSGSQLREVQGTCWEPNSIIAGVYFSCFRWKFATCFCWVLTYLWNHLNLHPPPLHSWRVLSKPILSPLPHLRQGNKCPRPVRQQLLARREGTFPNMPSLKWMGFWFTTLLNLDTNLGILYQFWILDSQNWNHVQRVFLPT